MVVYWVLSAASLLILTGLMIGLVQIRAARRLLAEQLDALRAQQVRDTEAHAREMAVLNAQLRDVAAEVQRAELRLKRSTEEFRIVFNSVPSLIWIKDKENRILRVNQAVADSIGRRVDEIEGRPTVEIYPDEAEKYHNDDLEVIRSERPKLGITEPVQSLNEKRWVRTDKVPFRDANGNIAGVIVLSQDITERKLLEERLQHAQRMEAVGQLAGGVAHDFNNLLCVIQGCSDLLKLRLGAHRELLADVKVIQDAVERGSALTRQMLAFSRRQMLDPKVLDLNAVIRSLEPLLRGLINERMTLQLALCGETVRVRADERQIEQVLLNLCLNARDALPNGGLITIKTEVGENDLPAAGGEPAGMAKVTGPFVRLTISDNGVGMSAETQRHIFEPFFTTKPLGRGTGLGLATVYGIVNQSGGVVTFKSEVNAGTSFFVQLPRVSEAAEIILKAPTLSAGGRGETVLLVEDDVALRSVYVRLLQSQGYTVLDAASGEEADRLITNYTRGIDVLITDMIMGKMNGLELSERMLSVSPATKVLYISGHMPDESMRREVLRPGTAFIQKPFAPEALQQKLHELLSSRPAAQVSKAS